MIQNLKDLEKLLKLLRKQGVVDFKHGEISLKLGDPPYEQKAVHIEEEDMMDPYLNFPDGMLTPDQMIHYANGGLPENDPENQQ